MRALGLLLSSAVNDEYGAQIDAVAAEAGTPVRRLVPLSAAKELDAVDAAFFSRDLFSGNMRQPGPMSDDFFKVVDAAPRLHWLQVFSSGLDLPQYSASLARGIEVTNSAGTTALPIAQSLAAAVLGQTRGFGHWLNAQRERKWAPLAGADRPREIAGQRMVVVGAGPIAVEIGRLLGGLGFHTTAVRRLPIPAPHFHQSATFEKLDSLLPSCDWLVLACPLNQQTRELMSVRRLDLLAPHARLANVGRGELVNESALIERLRDGRLAGAYLDVFSQEPLPEQSPLWDLPNVWMTPHNCAASQGHEARVVAKFLTDLRRWLASRSRS